MLNLNINCITGFIGCCEIYDERGNLFYIQSKRYKKWNLPQGNYFSYGKFNKLNNPVKFSTKPLPQFEKDGKIDLPYELTFTETLNSEKTLAYIILNGNVDEIFIDNSVRDYPIFVQEFIFYHELGHRLYETEKYCDWFAFNKLIELGYNPSQIRYAAHLTLKGCDRNNHIGKLAKG